MSSYRHRHFVDNDAEMLSASAPPLSQSESAARIAELEARLVSQREESEARVAELEAIIASQREDLAVANGKLLLSRTASVPVAEQSENEALRAALKETQQVLGDVQVERNHWRLAEEDAQLQISALEERVAKLRASKAAMQQQQQQQQQVPVVPEAQYNELLGTYNALVAYSTQLEEERTSLKAYSDQAYGHCQQLEAKIAGQKVEIDRLLAQTGTGYVVLKKAHETLKEQKRVLGEKKKGMDAHYKALFDKNAVLVDWVEENWRKSQDGVLTAWQEDWLVENKGWKPENLPEYGA